MSLYVDVSPQVEAQLFNIARREGIELGDLIERMVNEYRSSSESSEKDELGGKTVGELYGSLLGTVSFAAADVAARDEEYLTMTGFGETQTERHIRL